MSTPEAVQSKASIRLMGRFEVVVDGESIEESAWRGRKAQQLVKLLAVAAGRSLHREQIADALWPDLDADAADRQLHKAIHAARRALEPELGAGAGSAWIITQDRTVALSASVDIDADEAEGAAEAALASRDARACEAALERFAGPLLPGDLYDTWTESRRARLSSLHVRLLAAAAEGSLKAGHVDRAADAANRLLAIDAADERAHRVLMQVASDSGDRSAVVRQFRACETALESELGVEPSDATRTLFEDLISRSPGPDARVEAISEPTIRKPDSSNEPSRLVDASVDSRGSASVARRVGLAVAILLVAVAAAFLGVPRLRTLIWNDQPAGTAVVALTGTLPSGFVRVSLLSSASGWSSFSNGEGRFVLRDTALRAGESITLVVDGGGDDRLAVRLRVPVEDENGVADVGSIDGAALVPMGDDQQKVRSLPLDRANLEWYRGVAAAITSGMATDHERVNAIHAFVTRRYTRPADNGPTDTPRRTIEAGTLYSGPLPVAMATLTQAAGFETRLVALSAPRPVDMEHTVVEVFYGGRWHLFDPAFGVAAVNDIGEIANLEDLVRHPELIDRMPYADAVRPGWRGAEIPGLLRSGVHRITLIANGNR